MIPFGYKNASILMHSPGRMKKTKEVPELVRFTFWGVKLIYDRRSHTLGIQLGQDWAIICHKKGRHEMSRLTNTKSRPRRRTQV